MELLAFGVAELAIHQHHLEGTLLIDARLDELDLQSRGAPVVVPQRARTT